MSADKSCASFSMEEDVTFLPSSTSASGILGVISLHAGADGRLSEVTGKENRAAQVNHLGQCLLAGQWVSVSVLK